MRLFKIEPPHEFSMVLARIYLPLIILDAIILAIIGPPLMGIAAVAIGSIVLGFPWLAIYSLEKWD